MTEEISNSKMPSVKDKYELLIKARNFHYENYSKWMTYFYVAISALFVSYYTVISKDKVFPDQALFEIAILILGFTISLLWFWSAKGYYYWNINFMVLIHYYEKDIFQWPKEERIYAVFANKQLQNDYSSPVKGANISTSKVAILFAWIITAFWGFLLFFKLFSFLFYKFVIMCDCEREFKYLVMLFAAFASVFSIWFLCETIPEKLLYSKIDHLPDLQLSQETEK